MVELRSMPGRAADRHQDGGAGRLAAHISAGVDTLTPASMPSCQSTVPSDRITGKRGRVVVGAVVGGVVGGVVVPPVHAPRSFHSDGVAAGFQPAPT
jgi:hypothetical protein